MRKLWLFVALVVVCVAASAGYLVHASARQPKVTAAGVVDPGLAPAGVRAQPHVLYRSGVAGADGLVGVAPLAGLAPGAPTLLDLQCRRIDWAAGHGICLTEQGSLFTPYNIVFLDRDLRPTGRESLAGIISRGRVSPDGRYGAATVFVSGHSYAPGSFSTQTTIYDLADGSLIGELEQFDVFQDGEAFESPDFNFWGVTFGSDADTFYATLGTGGHTYLVKGSLADNRVDVLRDGVECPSLSPDGTKIAFKQRVNPGAADPVWRPAVLDVANLVDGPLSSLPLPETRNVDDQIEWLDDSTVLYGVKDGGRISTWATAADGRTAPRLFLEDADSPAVVRPQL